MTIANRACAVVLVVSLYSCGSVRSVSPLAPVPGALAAGTVVLPIGYDSTRHYPVIVMLPASNGRADAMLRSYPNTDEWVVVLSAGLGSTEDYRTSRIWEQTIERYEWQLRADLDLLAVAHVDTSRVFLAGFSMGGDLAWALSVRNASRVKGAVVMGSRMSYRGPPGDVRDLAARGLRMSVVMGRDEDRTRMAGARTGVALLETLRVPHTFTEVPNLAHIRPPAEVFRQALAFVLDTLGR
jgi:pimeloyl-ACP methyl ester carboxylesterase